MINIKNSRECFFDDYLINTEATTAPYATAQAGHTGSGYV
jgi:hypothetical protein